MPNSCYIHIPFCLSKCKYCSFVSFENTELITGYVYSLLKEISENYKGEKLETLYLGGGTPSLVPVNLLSKITGKFVFDSNSEVTIEVNPNDCTQEYMNSLISCGFNRISIGSQTFNDRLLKLIGRRHTSEEIFKAVEFAKFAGFKNISLDLIYGLPEQTLKDIEFDLEKFSELDIQHISTYGLKIEGGCYWGNNPPENIPEDDAQADMYELINKFLTGLGYERYEVSNFAKPGYESKHNLTYWNNQEYYGFGVSAHGYENGLRYSNYCSLKEYMAQPTNHEYGRLLSEKEKLEEEIFLGFRKTKGVNTQRIKEKFDVDFELKYVNVLEKYKEFFVKTPDGYALTLRGIMLSNEILPEFLED